MSELQELIVIEKKNIREVFVSEDGIDPILAKIKSEIDKFTVLDMSIKKDRDEVKSRVTKIKKCKTYLENIGKDLAAELKKEPKLVDNSRKKAKEQLNEWEEMVRRPLTEWEAAEKERVNSIHRKINSMSKMLDVEVLESCNSSVVSGLIVELENIEIDDSFEELKKYAQTTKTNTLNQLYKWEENKKKHEAEQAELEALRAAKAAQEEKERKEAEAMEAERKIAEAIEAEAKRIREAEEKVRREAEERQLEAQRKAEQEAQELKLKAERAEQAAREAEESAERKIAEAKAEHERKVAEQKRAEEAEAKRREEDLSHRKKINNQAVKCLMRIGRIDKELAIEIVTAIAKKEVDNVEIKY